MVRYNFPKYKVELEIPKDVYHPEEDSFLLLDSIEVTKDHQLLLEIGGGSGIISIVLAHRNPKLRCIVTDISLNAVNVIKRNSHLNMLNNRVDAVCMDMMNALRYFCPDIIVWNPPYLPSDKETELLSNEEKKMLIGGRKGYEEVYELFNYLRFNRIKTDFYTIFSSLAWDKSKLHELENQGFSVQIIEEKKIFFEKLYSVKSKFSDSDV